MAIGSFEATNKILENLKMKYKYVDNIFTLTKNMEQAVMSNDIYSFGKYIDMRGDIIMKIDSIDKENRGIAEKLPEPVKTRILSIIMPKKKVSTEVKLDNPLETNIYDTNKRIANLLGKILKIDEEINEKTKVPGDGRRNAGSWNA